MSKQTQQLIEQARDKWIQKLTDLSRRNNLLYYRALSIVYYLIPNSLNLNPQL